MPSRFPCCCYLQTFQLKLATTCSPLALKALISQATRSDRRAGARAREYIQKIWSYDTIICLDAGFRASLSPSDGQAARADIPPRSYRRDDSAISCLRRAPIYRFLAITFTFYHQVRHSRAAKSKLKTLAAISLPAAIHGLSILFLLHYFRLRWRIEALPCAAAYPRQHQFSGSRPHFATRGQSMTK